MILKQINAENYENAKGSHTFSYHCKCHGLWLNKEPSKPIE